MGAGRSSSRARAGAGEGEQVLGRLEEHGLDLGELAAEHAAMTSSWERTCSASGWAKTVRMAATTVSALPFETRASTSPRKCTQQSFPAEPSRTASIAPFSPVCASETTSWVPAKSRGLQQAQEGDPEGPSSLSPTAEPKSSRCPSGATPVAMTTAWETTRRLIRALQ